nr:MAG TPA: hypothetical protein [Caudoviricetes sp.]
MVCFSLSHAEPNNRNHWLAKVFHGGKQLGKLLYTENDLVLII